jgi:hypothetical protein
LPCFDEPARTSDSQLASLTSIGTRSNAAVRAMTVRRRGTPGSEGTNFPPDDGIPGFPQNDFPIAHHGSTAHH